MKSKNCGIKPGWFYSPDRMHGGKRLRAKYGNTGDWLMNAKLGLVSSRIGDLCGKWLNVLDTDWEHFKSISFVVSTLLQLIQKQKHAFCRSKSIFLKKEDKMSSMNRTPMYSKCETSNFSGLSKWSLHYWIYMWQRHKWTLKNWFLQSLYQFQFCHLHLWRLWLWHWYLKTNHSTCLLVNYLF